MKRPGYILPIIVFAQFCCTSLWFAGNGVIDNLVLEFELAPTALGHLTSAVQFGFIVGTLTFAILCIVDRFSPSKVFLISALFGALCNLGALLEFNALPTLFAFRFLTGFFLAGIYPVGMKIAADYFDKTLGKSLGFLVGALVLGTALPHLLSQLTSTYPWQAVLVTTSVLATAGGFIMLLFVPDGPFRKPTQQPELTAFFDVFRQPKFRSVAFGYFGHMWELYAFWAFVPVILQKFNNDYGLNTGSVPLLSFLVIGIGSFACVLGGYLSQRFGPKKVAVTALLLSCLCCLISPLVLTSGSEVLVLTFLLFWGMVVIADSPLLSTLVAQGAPAAKKGTALTIVNCIGFATTIISIQLLTAFIELTDSNTIFVLLAAGPIVGLIALQRVPNDPPSISTE